MVLIWPNVQTHKLPRLISVHRFVGAFDISSRIASKLLHTVLEQNTDAVADSSVSWNYIFYRYYILHCNKARINSHFTPLPPPPLTHTHTHTHTNTNTLPPFLRI